MTECFLPPTSSPSEHRRVEHGSGLTRTPSSEEISPTKFPGLYRTGEPSPPHDILHEPPDIVSDDEKDHGKKKGKFKKKEKRTEGYAAFQEDSSGDEAESPSKMKRSKGIHVFKKPIIDPQLFGTYLGTLSCIFCCQARDLLEKAVGCLCRAGLILGM
uniref:RalA binding protein 1 n=1 Tax=Colobus angolensis palliatus TaxID=336983 RepID=A0A2K5IW67_COLAP